MSSSIVSVLRSFQALVGSDEFSTAVNVVLSGSEAVPSTMKAKKERKATVVDPVKSAKRSADMAALQAFIKHVRSEAAEGTPYKDVQQTAGLRWKDMSDEDKAKWAPAVPAEKNLTVTTPTPAVAKVSVKAVKTAAVPVPEPAPAPAPEPVDAPVDKKARGRPTKP